MEYRSAECGMENKRMRVAAILGKENRKTIERALKRYAPMIAVGEEFEQLSEKEERWVDVVLKLLVWCKNTEYEQLIYFRYVMGYKHTEMAAALCVDRSTVFKMLGEVQIFAALKAAEYGLITI